ncbi:hypothetical protein U1Q18_010045, partial [Sarracenia purpurea var. burkii]
IFVWFERQLRKVSYEESESAREKGERRKRTTKSSEAVVSMIGIWGLGKFGNG